MNLELIFSDGSTGISVSREAVRAMINRFELPNRLPAPGRMLVVNLPAPAPLSIFVANTAPNQGR